MIHTIKENLHYDHDDWLLESMLSYEPAELTNLATLTNTDPPNDNITTGTAEVTVTANSDGGTTTLTSKKVKPDQPENVPITVTATVKSTGQSNNYDVTITATIDSAYSGTIMVYNRTLEVTGGSGQALTLTSVGTKTINVNTGTAGGTKTETLTNKPSVTVKFDEDPTPALGSSTYTYNTFYPNHGYYINLVKGPGGDSASSGQDLWCNKWDGGECEHAEYYQRDSKALAVAYVRVGDNTKKFRVSIREEATPQYVTGAPKLGLYRAYKYQPASGKFAFTIQKFTKPGPYGSETLVGVPGTPTNRVSKVIVYCSLDHTPLLICYKTTTNTHHWFKNTGQNNTWASTDSLNFPPPKSTQDAQHAPKVRNVLEETNCVVRGIVQIDVSKQTTLYCHDEHTGGDPTRIKVKDLSDQHPYQDLLNDLQQSPERSVFEHTPRDARTLTISAFKKDTSTSNKYLKGIPTGGSTTTTYITGVKRVVVFLNPSNPCLIYYEKTGVSSGQHEHNWYKYKSTTWQNESNGQLNGKSPEDVAKNAKSNLQQVLKEIREDTGQEDPDSTSDTTGQPLNLTEEGTPTEQYNTPITLLLHASQSLHPFCRMSERKVLNKYIPPDFDPELLRKHRHILKTDGVGRRRHGFARKLGLTGRVLDIRMMYPFTVRCEKCREFTYSGTKFNSQVERLEENYLGIQKYRLYGKCKHCDNMIVFKTDPKSGGYVLESGGTRTYDANRDAELAAEAIDREEEEKAETQDRTERMLDKANHAYAEYEELERLTALKKRAGRMRERERLADLALQKVMQEKFEIAADEEELKEFERQQALLSATGSLNDEWPERSEDDASELAEMDGQSESSSEGNEWRPKGAVDDGMNGPTEVRMNDGMVKRDDEQDGSNGVRRDAHNDDPPSTRTIHPTSPSSSPLHTATLRPDGEAALPKRQKLSQVPDVFGIVRSKVETFDTKDPFKGIKVVRKKDKECLTSGYDSDE